MNDDKRLVRRVYEGEVISSVKVLGVTLKAGDETVQSYNEAVGNLRRSLKRLKEAVTISIRQRPDEKDIIDQ